MAERIAAKKQISGADDIRFLWCIWQNDRRRFNQPTNQKTDMRVHREATFPQLFNSVICVQRLEVLPGVAGVGQAKRGQGGGGENTYAGKLLAYFCRLLALNILRDVWCNIGIFVV